MTPTPPRTHPRDVPPTPSREWVREGDRCLSPTGMRGEVLRIGDAIRSSLPRARVRWENGHVGTVTITLLRRDPTP